VDQALYDTHYEGISPASTTQKSLWFTKPYSKGAVTNNNGVMGSRLLGAKDFARIGRPTGVYMRLSAQTMRWKLAHFTLMAVGTVSLNARLI